MFLNSCCPLVAQTAETLDTQGKPITVSESKTRSEDYLLRKDTSFVKRNHFVAVKMK
jgi:hypothetical protein